MRGFTLRQDDKTVVEGLNLTVQPRVSYRGDALDVSLNKLTLDGGKGTLATADFTATVPLAEQPGAINARAGH